MTAPRPTPTPGGEHTVLVPPRDGSGRYGGRGSTRGEDERLGPYRLVHVLGEGGMGVVHLALDPRGRAVAIKVLRDHVAQDRDSRARLAREVSSLARVRHPLVAPVLDADTTGPRPYVVTRYVPGVALDDIVREGGAFHGERLVRLGRGLAAAIDAIHTAGIVHRDLKPGNVLIVEDDPVVIDFGIAHVADDTRLTSTGLVMGTPGYLSPEVVAGEHVTPATDWWGWAATIAFAATGRPPFGRGPMPAVLDRVRDGRADLEGIDPDLRDLLSRALSPDAGRRPGPKELLAGLAAYGETAGRFSATTVEQPVRGGTATLPAQPPGPPQHQRPSPPVVAEERGAPRPQGPAEDRPRRRTFELRRGGASAPTAPAPATAVGGATAAPVPRPGPQGTDPRMGDPRLGRPGRGGALTALGLCLMTLTATWPFVAFSVAAVWAVLARAGDRVVTATVLRRHAHGAPRRSDGIVAALTSPLHLLVAAVATLVSGVLVVLVGLSVAFLVSVLGGALVGHELSVWGAPAMAAGALSGLWTAWWGPGGRSLRRGSRSLMRAMTPDGLGVDLVTSGLVLAAVVLGVWSVVSHGVPEWQPSGPPTGRSYVPWQW